MNGHTFFEHKQIRLIDHSHPGALQTAMASFAVDDTLCQTIGKSTNDVAVRFWVHPKTVVLGAIDTRLPAFAEAHSFLQQQGYEVVVRNSGGLAVNLDDGVLNVSFIIPDTPEMGIHSGYALMTDSIRSLFSSWTKDIEAYEITGSYCPGDYDLSIDGKKFAGISQRRVKGGIAVQIYICVEGSGSERAALIRDFYTYGKANVSERFTYPTVDPQTMRSVNELLHTDFSTAKVQQLIMQWLSDTGAFLYEHDIQDEELLEFEKRMTQMVERNAKALE
ncbi:lipoate-protein ligase A [Gracilibacillus halophilus YIM-C55.5]|uniref:Octanoyl-[GcvH]:protein N-octanoyltransferase n=1 Tax=Gracilibacillus halophilus YIM-C55.5 TaxID=1308866 RepID=N4WNF6_9BACI|nr:biotin/lipoate A/B protein ligase family protein [Gracilibacillus halophilus]ENH97662.1 lipoate-protein ligase A [Gracilibacillus halophilus YIM-C55.5]